LPHSSKSGRKPGRVAAPETPPAEQYVADVLSGKIPVSKYVRQAVQRHVSDLRDGHNRGLYFDRTDAEFAIKCFQFFRHSKGKWAGEVFVLSPWQQFIIWCLFGWKRKGGVRRFKRAYIEVARKNGKSTLLAGIAIILLALDGEQGAEVYSAATKEDQARIVFNEARRMVKSSPELKQFILTSRDAISVPDTESVFKPLSADADSLDGLNLHGGIIDELHAHKTREVWDVLDTATGSREQPLLVTITTAGFNQEGICYEVRGHCADLLEGLFEDDSYFAFIACIDPEDNWQDESCWIKANPNLGVSNSLDDLQDKAKRALRTTSARNNFLIKHLCRWTQQAQLWIPIEKWDACASNINLASLAGRDCYVGIDLADKLDLNGICFLFPPHPGEKWRIICQFWMPEDVMQMRCDEGQWHYKQWAEKELLRLTPGNITDYDVIREEFIKIAKTFRILEIGFDPYNATHFATQLATAGYSMVEVPQRMQKLCEASKEFEAMVAGMKIEHDGSPVLRWMAMNVEIEMDKNQNIRPIQPKDRRKKVDGIVAAVTGLSRAIHYTGSSSDQIEVW
jgi:phage terminase large subunit-like protein